MPLCNAPEMTAKIMPHDNQDTWEWEVWLLHDNTKYGSIGTANDWELALREARAAMRKLGEHLDLEDDQ